MKHNSFILSREPLDFKAQDVKTLEILTIHKTIQDKIVLVRKRTQFEIPQIINLSKEGFGWLQELQVLLKKTENILIFVQNQPLTGILGLLNCIRREPGGGQVKCCFIDDTASPFDLSDPFYYEQLGKNLAVNVWRNGQWGTYRHLLLEEINPSQYEHCLVNTQVKGDLSSLTWVQGPLSAFTEMKREEELVHVRTNSF